MMIITQIKAGETEKIVKEEMAGEMIMVSLGVKGFSAKSRNHPKIRQHMTHSHSMVEFGGQFTLTSDGQINRQTALLMFKWHHMLTKLLVFLRYAYIWSVTLVSYSKSAGFD